MAHVQGSTGNCLQLEIGPLQSECLTTAQSGGQQHEVKRLAPIAPNRFQKTTPLLRREHPSLVLFVFASRLYECHYIPRKEPKRNGLLQRSTQERSVKRNSGGRKATLQQLGLIALEVLRLQLGKLVPSEPWREIVSKNASVTRDCAVGSATGFQIVHVFSQPSADSLTLIRRSNPVSAVAQRKS
jgi:hypothetical protein